MMVSGECEAAAEDNDVGLALTQHLNAQPLNLFLLLRLE
jgi:hypothetical protein